MNLAYLSRFSADIRPITDASDTPRQLPRLWNGIASNSGDRRLEAFRIFVDEVFVHMPETRTLLLARTVDAYLVQSGDDVLFVADRKADDRILSYRGFAPRGEARFGGSVGSFYRTLDGFADFHSMGGLIPERDMRPMGADGNEFWTEPSSATYETLRSQDYVNIFNSGGKAQGYVSISSTMTDEPVGALLFVDDDSPMTDMDFWHLFDNWTAIAMED